MSGEPDDPIEEADDERDTLRAPPRLDETPTAILTLTKDAFRTAAGQVPAPIGSLPATVPGLARVALRSVTAQVLAPQPIGRVSLPAVDLPVPQPASPPVFPPPMLSEVARSSPPATPPPLPVRATRQSPKPPPLPARVAPALPPLRALAATDDVVATMTEPAPMPPLLTAPTRGPAGEPSPPNLDDIPTLRPDAVEAADADDERDDASAPPAPFDAPFAGVREFRIPPLPVPKDLPKLLELERGGSDSTRPALPELRPPTYVTTLSPAERAARRAEPRARRERGRGRLLGGLAIAAAGVLVIGGSALWQPVAEPVMPRRATASAARTQNAPASAPVPASAPAPATSPAVAVSATAEPPSPQLAVAPEPPITTEATAPSAVRPSAPRAAPPDADPVAVAAAVEPPLAPAPPRARPAATRTRPPPTPAIDPATLPEAPTRQAVIDALAPLREEIARCSEGRGGVAEIMLTVDGSGAVRHASLVGDYAGTPQGSCIALAARKARFSPFRQERFSVRYPVAL